MTWRRAAFLSLLLLAAAGCTRPGGELPEDPSRELVDVPFHAQTAWHCGPAALATVLGSTGREVSPEALAPRVYVPARRGSFQPELVAATRTEGRIPYVLEPRPEALTAELRAGNPVLVLQDLGLFGIRRWHYAVLVGADEDAGLVVLRSGAERRRVERRADFLASWEPGGRWALVVNRPGDIPATATPGRYVRTLAETSPRLPAAERARAHAAALARWPEDPEVVFAAANERYAAGELPRAEALYRELLARTPGDVAARNNLASLLLDRGCGRDARAEAEKAVADAGADGPFAAAARDTLAKARSAPAGTCPTD